MTTVVNIKYSGCDTYIGRNGSYCDHVSRCQLCQRRPLNLCPEGLSLVWFGNPFEIGKDGTRAEVITKYKEYLWWRIKKFHSFRMRVRKLRGQTLGCFCKHKNPEAVDVPCHGDVLAEAAEDLNQ